MRRFLVRCLNLFRRRSAEREMTREIDSHLALLQEDFERRGLGPAEAALAARRAYGGVEQSKELHRDARTFVWVEQLAKDLRYGCRNLARQPGFTVVAAIALALGIGVNATLFGIYNAIVLKPLPVADPGRVVRLKRWFAQRRGDSPYYFTEAEYEYLRERTTAFSSLVASYGGNDGDGIAALATSTAWNVHAQLHGGHAVSANYFSELGVRLRLGRGFLPDEDRSPGANPVVVLDYRAWERIFRRNPAVLGQPVELNGIAYTIVGVGPKEFNGTDMTPVQPDFWVPYSMRDEIDPVHRTARRGEGQSPPQRLVYLLGRLKDGASRSRARAEVELLMRQFPSPQNALNRTIAITLERLSYFDYSNDLSDFQSAALMIAVLVGLVLLVACANVTNMLLARGAARRREIAVRMALGAGRRRVVRQLLVESLLLALLGGAAAIPLSAWTARLFYASLMGVMRGFHYALIEVDLTPDVRVFACGFVLSLAAAALVGVAPALRLTRLDLNAAMKDDAWVFGARLSRSRLRSLLLGIQVAASVLLLITSGALLTLVTRARTGSLGYDPRHTYLLMTADTEGTSNETAPKAALKVRERLRSVPEVAASALGGVPLDGDWSSAVMLVGKQAKPTIVSNQTEDYFETLAIRMLRGRGFTAQETRRHAPIAVISEATARSFWPGQNAIGLRFSLGFPQTRYKDLTEYEVIGVAADIRDNKPDRLDASHIYLPSDGSPGTYEGGLLFRVRGDRQKALAAVQAAVESVDRSLLSGLNLVNLEEGPVAMYRNLYGVLAAFSSAITLLALALAAVGIYGVMAFLVSQRTREIGIRMALGANSPAILRHVALNGLLPVGIGMTMGIAAAAGLEMLVKNSADIDTSLLNPATSGLLVLVPAISAAASIIPVRRAMRVDPAAALRHE